MSDTVRKRPAALGRGLSALFGDEPGGRQAAPGGVRQVAVTEMAPHPEQPRRQFDDDALDELATSIRARGIIQPIVVRELDGGYQIVAGERRWRAAQRAGLHEVPVIVRAFDEAETLEIALVENIQREDLNAIEEADAYRKLIDRFGHSQEALGRIVHKSRSHVANLLRLLDLPPTVQGMLSDGRLSMGHARALVSSGDAEALADAVVAKGLSVRQTEALVRRGRAARPGTRATPQSPDADLAALERQLGDLLGLDVRIQHGGTGGSVAIAYRTLDQLDLICQRLSGEPI